MIETGLLQRRAALLAVASLAVFVACGDSADPLPTPLDPTLDPVPARIGNAFGDRQTGEVGERLPRPVGVIVEDGPGEPVSGAVVRFAMVEGNGTANPSETTTDGNGLARTTWILGTRAGTNHVIEASLVGSDVDPVQFTATARPSYGVLLTLLSGDGQTGTAGEPLAELVWVSVTDRFGNGVPKQLVKFSPNTGHGVMTPADTPADENGLASTRWTLAGFTGMQDASIWSPGLTGSPARISATAQ